MLRLAVIGDPVAHSLSPALHREFMAAAAIEGTYDAIRVAAGEAASAIERLRAEGYAGLNVTTPLKEEAFACCERRDAVAEASGSVNTVVFEGDAIAGYNTDGIGAVAALRAALGANDLAQTSVLVLGAGPTARAAVRALLDARVRVSIWNRTNQRAHSVAENLGAELWTPDKPVDAVFATLAPNATLVEPELRAAVVAAPIVIDANYGERATLAAVLDRPIASGTTMLEASARASFEHFLRARPA